MFLAARSLLTRAEPGLKSPSSHVSLTFYNAATLAADVFTIS
jgi:hypothetical protein